MIIIIIKIIIIIGCGCPPTGDSVCGVDGKDYVNACEADCAGIQIDCKGSCPCKGKGKVKKTGD